MSYLFSENIIFPLIDILIPTNPAGKQERHRQARQRQKANQIIIVQQSNPAVGPISIPPVALNHPPPQEFPLAFTTQINLWKALELGGMNVICSSCNALHWIDERSQPSTKSLPRFESCCKKGDVILESLPDPPDILKRLLSTEDADSKRFRKHIREYPDMKMSFHIHMTTQQWMHFLQFLKEVSLTFEQKLIICPKLTMFGSSESKRLLVQTARNEVATAILNGVLTPDEGNALIEDWVQGLTIGGFLPMIRSCGILAVFTNALGNAIEQQSQDSVSWHTYVIFYKNGVLAVYDPSFTPGTTHFDSCNGVSLVKGLVKAFRGRSTNRRVTEIWFGGGCNDGTNCQEMTRRWIEQEIVINEGADLGNWDRREGWVKVHF
ncbi:hypothetical protein L873DRAFT_1896321 [Choiromyces venosus 120613-1]|uniref:Uncharacterized protein n=1 Tax=Choiromyces venosus 120613-1 TaxID=1336337 RepID=A0A3N4JX28_9PEZI|nr:hypothetical protein L873DRAFT_1896321 [Choiromyces venosus 120613-1]